VARLLPYRDHDAGRAPAPRCTDRRHSALSQPLDRRHRRGRCANLSFVDDLGEQSSHCRRIDTQQVVVRFPLLLWTGDAIVTTKSGQIRIGRPAAATKRRTPRKRTTADASSNSLRANTD
jgi:hypothetical protein